MAQVYTLPTQRYAGELIIELDPTREWSGVANVILASDGTAWLDMARLPVAGGGTENRIVSVEASGGADDPVETLRAVIHMRTDAGGSLSPDAVTDPLNNLHATFSPAVYAGRRIIWQEALASPTSLDPADWQTLHWGYLQDPRVTASGNLQLFSLDASSRLQIPYTGEPIWIGTEGEHLPLDEAIQAGLDAVFGDGVWRLKSPADIEWAVPAHEMGAVPNMLEWAREAAQQRGAVVRWWPDAVTGRPQLTLFVLQEDKESPDYTFSPGATEDITAHGSDLVNYRNDFTLRYMDAVSGEIETLRRPATEGEKAAFGLRPQAITEASTSLIDTEAEAETMLDSVEAALRTPETVGTRVLPWAPGIQINALIRFAADGRVLQAAIDGYVVRWTKRKAISGTNVERTVTVDYRAAPVGQITTWLRSFARAIVGRPLPLDSAILAVDLIAQTADTRTYQVWRGAAVAVAEVYWVLFPAPLPDGYIGDLYGADALQATLAADGEPFVAPQPQEGEVLAIAVVPKSGAASTDASGDAWEIIVLGGTALIDMAATFTRLSPTTERGEFMVIDPRRVVSHLVVYETLRGVRTGPHIAVPAGKDEYHHTFTLNRDHPVYLRVEAHRLDGAAPLVRNFTADFDEVPGIPEVREYREGGQVTVYADAADTDSATLWRRQVSGAGVPGAESQIPARGADPRFGAFTFTVGAAGDRYHIYARTADGVPGEYRDYRVSPYVQSVGTQYLRALVERTAISDTTVSYRASSVPSSVVIDGATVWAQVRLQSLSGATLLSGPPIGAPAPNNTIWTLSRPAQYPGEAVFRANLLGNPAGYVDDIDPVQVPEVGNDSMSLSMRARVMSSSPTAVVIRADVIDPDPIPGPTGNITIRRMGMDGLVSPAAVERAIPSASVRPDFGDDGLGWIEYTVTRPAFGAGSGRVTLVASRAQRTSDSDSVDVPEQLPPVMREVVSETLTTGTLQLIPHPAAVFTSVRFRTKSGNAAWSPASWDSAPAITTAPFSATVALHHKHNSAIAYRVYQGSAIVQENTINGFDVGTIANVSTATATPNGDGTAGVHVTFDTDTATGTGRARHRVDGGAPTALTVSGSRVATFTVAQSAAAEILVEISAQNAAGDWGPWHALTVPRYLPIVDPNTPLLTQVTATANALGNCATGAPATVLISWQVLNRKEGQGHAIQIWRYDADGLIDQLVASGLEPLSGTFNDPLTGWETNLSGVPSTYTYRVALSDGAGINRSEGITGPVQIYLVACI